MRGLRVGLCQTWGLCTHVGGLGVRMREVCGWGFARPGGCARLLVRWGAQVRGLRMRLRETWGLCTSVGAQGCGCARSEGGALRDLGVAHAFWCAGVRMREVCGWGLARRGGCARLLTRGGAQVRGLRMRGVCGCGFARPGARTPEGASGGAQARGRRMREVCGCGFARPGARTPEGASGGAQVRGLRVGLRETWGLRTSGGAQGCACARSAHADAPSPSPRFP